MGLSSAAALHAATQPVSGALPRCQRGGALEKTGLVSHGCPSSPAALPHPPRPSLAQLSADWSYPCVPLVRSWADPRNVLSALLYAAVAAAALTARPWMLLRDVLPRRPPPVPAHSGSDDGAGQPIQPEDSDARIHVRVLAASPGEGLRTARWRLAMLVVFVLGPMLPASNILFYVGTFLAERLLLLPSGEGGGEGATRPGMDGGLAGGAERASGGGSPQQ